MGLLSLLGRTCARDENTQHHNRDIKIMKQIPREIGWHDARLYRALRYFIASL